MGMFDRVWATCPACGEQVEFQSKAGDCNLASYSNRAVPMEIAKALDGRTETCVKCDKQITLRIPKTTPTRIAMEISTGDQSEFD